MGTGRWSPRAFVRRIGEDTAVRIRRSGRTALYRALRLTGAAVASYVVARSFSPEAQPLVAPLTALLVVQVTLFSTLTRSVERVVSVVAGVLLALGFTAVVGITWWSLGLIIGISIIIGQLLRLGDNLLEVPISAMLVLGVGFGTESAAYVRILETVMGAAVGVIVNLLFPPAVRSVDAGTAVEEFAGRIAGLLDEAAAELAAGPSDERVGRWLDEARALNRHVPHLDAAIAAAVESRRLNVRAIGTPEVGPVLRDGVEALEHASVAVRTMFRSISDAMAGGMGGGQAEYASDVRGAFAVLLTDLAGAVRAFGRLVRAEVDEDAEGEEAELVAALEGLREARARVTELLLIGPRSDPQMWEFNVSVLATVERMLRELDVAEHVRLQERRRRAEEERSRRREAAQRIRATTRQLADLPGRLRGEEEPGTSIGGSGAHELGAPEAERPGADGSR